MPGTGLFTAGAIDLTGDGVSEILAGNHSREVLVFDGATCAIHRRISDAGSSASLNGRITFTEDLTSDGVPDIPASYAQPQGRIVAD